MGVVRKVAKPPAKPGEMEKKRRKKTKVWSDVPAPCAGAARQLQDRSRIPTDLHDFEVVGVKSVLVAENVLSQTVQGQ